MTASARRGAVFFDRDGVLNRDTGYPHRVEQFEWMPGAPEAIALVKRAGLLAIVVTNQSGIARGYYDENAMHRVHEWMNSELHRQVAAGIDAFEFCPYHPEATISRYRHPNHPDRKPNPGMLLRAMDRYDLDAWRCLMIGDHESDMKAAEAAGVRGHLFKGGRLDTDLDFLLGRELTS